MDTTVLFLFLVFFVLGYAVREFIGGSKKQKPKQNSREDTVMRFWIDEQKVQHIELEGEEARTRRGASLTRWYARPS